MQLTVTKRDATWWSQFRNEKNVQAYVVLSPTSRWESKQWPIERFIEVAKHVAKKGMQVVVVGAPSEVQQVEPLSSTDSVFNLLPEMTIGRLMAVIESSDCVIANDSAALHMAVGFHRPCIGLFGPTNPARVGPYEREDAVIAAEVDYNNVHYRDLSLGDSLMRQITTEEVIAKVNALVGRTT
jgi:ADP-heptose:LPS heptosyltransferase